MSSVAAFCRHDLVWLQPTWREALLAPLAPEDEAAVAGWVDRGRPAVVCRRVPGAPAEALSLGVALPGPGRRLGFQVSLEAVRRRTGPLRLRDAAASAPRDWRTELLGLDKALLTVGTSAGVFGSLAWQHLAGEPYLRPGSDVDLLLSLLGPASLWAGLEVLEAHDVGTVRLDGEVVLQGGRAIAWRELMRRPERVLVKSLDGVALLPVAEALGPYAEELS